MNDYLDPSHISVAHVLKVFRDQGAASRAELARLTGLSPATITGITRKLLQDGYLRVAGAQPASGRGRPPEMLEYDARARCAIGLELHNFRLAGVVTDLYGQLLHSHVIEPVPNGPEAVVAAVVRWVREVSALPQAAHCAAIGLAIPGLVNGDTGEIVYSVEFDLPSISLADLLEREIGIRPTLTNRAPAAALAESWLGVGKGVEDLIYFRVGGYIGGAFILDGLPFLRGGHQVASLAHMVVQPGGLACRCGNRGCLDTVASASAMARRARELLKRGNSGSLLERVQGRLELLTGEMVVEEAEDGDAVAQTVVREAAEWLGIAVANCVNLLAPDLVVIGGTVGCVAGEYYLDSLRQSAGMYMTSIARQHTNIVATQLGLEAVACGAAAMAINAGLIRSISVQIPQTHSGQAASGS